MIRAAASSGEKIKLRVWSHQNLAFIKANEELIAKFMEQNPDIEVTYEQFEYSQFLQNLQTSMQAGTEADVIEMFGSWVCSYANGGRLAEMPEDVMGYTQARRSSILRRWMGTTVTASYTACLTSSTSKLAARW